MDNYKKPEGRKIPFSPKTEKLYDYEHEVMSALNIATEELARILGYDKNQFWTHALPEALLMVLDSWDTKASTMAALAFLEKQGYSVKKES